MYAGMPPMLAGLVTFYFTQEKHFSLADWSEVSKNEHRCCSSCKWYQSTTVPKRTLLYFIWVFFVFFGVCSLWVRVSTDSDFLPPSKVCLWMSDCNSVSNRLTPLPPRLQEKRRQSWWIFPFPAHPPYFLQTAEGGIFVHPSKAETQIPRTPASVCKTRLELRAGVSLSRTYIYLYTNTAEHLHTKKWETIALVLSFSLLFIPPSSHSSPPPLPGVIVVTTRWQ